MTAICLVFFTFGLAFHTLVMLTMSIDFIRFWIPALLAVGVVPMVGMGVEHGDGYALPDLATLLSSSSWFPWVIAVTFIVAHARLHDGKQWPASAFDLYNHFYPSDRIVYYGIDLKWKDCDRRTASWQPLDLTVCSSSGFTRSFGLLYAKMKQRGVKGQHDLQSYLHDFLPVYVRAQGWGRDDFTGCRVVKLGIEYYRSTGTVLVLPDETTGIECSWVK